MPVGLIPNFSNPFDEVDDRYQEKTLALYQGLVVKSQETGVKKHHLPLSQVPKTWAN